MIKNIFVIQEGRGLSAVAEVEISDKDLKDILKVDASSLIDLNRAKNHLGTLRGNLIRGANCHASNIVSGIFLATGQDLGQIGTSSQSIIDIDYNQDRTGIVMTNTMPCIEIGTIGGGTQLPDQKACLDIMGIKVNKDRPRDSVDKLAGTIMGTIMAGEISLLSAMVNSELVSSHMKYNRR